MVKHEFADLNSGRIPASRFFEPVLESLEDIVAYTAPQGKRVLSVAAFGFPLAFLSEGAKEVLSFDVDYSKIAWNHFLRASILTLNYEENSDFFRHEMSPSGLERIKEKVRKLIPDEYSKEALKYVFIFNLGCSHLKDRITQFYPHIRDKTTYERVKETANNGGWEISQDELLKLLEGVEISQKGRQFDVMYVSSIRNWVLDARYKNNVQWFEKDYDRKLGKLASSLLNEGGVFYETLISEQGFPRVKISPRLYRGFDIQEYPSQDVNSKSVIIVGKKLSVSEPAPYNNSCRAIEHNK